VTGNMQRIGSARNGILAVDDLNLSGDDRSGKPRPTRSPSAGEWGEKEPCVLVIDDEADALDAISELLEDEGLKTLRASDGAEALALLQAGHRPSLILLDLKMPVMDGREFLKRISSEPDLAEIPVAIVTASASLRDLPSRRNDAGFFTKPLDYPRLMKVIRFYCG